MRVWKCDCGDLYLEPALDLEGGYCRKGVGLCRWHVHRIGLPRLLWWVALRWVKDIWREHEEKKSHVRPSPFRD